MSEWGEEDVFQRGGCESQLRGGGWCSSWSNDLRGSTDTDDDWIVWVEEVDGLSRWLYFLPVNPRISFSNQFWINRLIFQCRVPRFFIPHFFLTCSPDSLLFFSPDRKGFERQRGNPAWGLFWYCWTFSWKTILFGDQQCSGLRAVGSSCWNTSSDHNSKNVSDELQTYSVFIAWARKTIVRQPTFKLKRTNSAFKFNVCRFSNLLPPYSGALCFSSVKKQSLKVQNINTATITYFLPGFSADSEVEGGRRHSQISSVLLFELECGLASD